VGTVPEVPSGEEVTTSSGLGQKRQARSGAVDPGSFSGVIALDEALTMFASLYPRQVKWSNCAFFGGLEVEETADALRISPVTARLEIRQSVAAAFPER
jgi:ECF sigma factor